MDRDYFDDYEDEDVDVYQEIYGKKKEVSYPLPIKETDDFILYAEKEIAKVRDGTSEFRKGAILFGSSPMLNTLGRFKSDNDPNLLHTFLTMASTEINGRIAAHLLNKVREFYRPALKWSL